MLRQGPPGSDLSDILDLLEKGNKNSLENLEGSEKLAPTPLVEIDLSGPVEPDHLAALMDSGFVTKTEAEIEALQEASHIAIQP